MATIDEYPLAPAQQRLWIIHRLNPLSTAYNAPVVRTLRGNVDPRRLEKALLQLLKRHEQLRATFSLGGAEPTHVIHDVSSFELVYLENVAVKDVSKTITQFIGPFALEHAPLLRAALIRVSDHAKLEPSYVLVMDIHHIVCDLRSEDILVRDLFALYHDLPLPEIGSSYTAQLHRQVEPSAAAGQWRADEEFWLSKFAGELPVLQLLDDHRRPAVFDFRGTIRHFPMGNERTKTLRAFATSHQVPLRDIALTAVFVLLAKYSFQEDLVIGMPDEARCCDDMAEVVGMFMNTLAIRANTHPDKTVRTLMTEVSEDLCESRRHSSYDVRYLVEKLRPPRDPSRNALYDVLFFHQCLQTDTYDGLEVAPRQFIHKKAEVDLTFGLLEIDDQLSFSIEFATSIYRSPTITRMAKHYGAVLDALVSSPDALLADIDILSVDERNRVASFSPPASPYPWKTINALFEEQVARSPNHPAIRYRNETLDYRELDTRANRVANMLLAHGADTGDVIALWSHPSLDTVAGSLGILKAGCVYLPISPDVPAARIAYMLRASKAKLVVAQDLPGEDLDDEIIELGLAARYPGDLRPQLERDPAAIACVLFTSGSTGNPKGTLMRHFNVVRTVVDTNHLAIRPSDRMLQLATPTFDVSMLEVFGALLNGATLVVADSDSRGDLSRIAALLDGERISVAFMTPALFNAMVDEKLSALGGLRQILTGGDRASADHMRKALARLGRGKLQNGYGPTEATIFTTYYPVDDVAADATNVPIGYPLSNARGAILNGRSPVPVGVVGELCIAGDGLVAGYLDEALTAQKFVIIAGERFYRTGDIAKWHDDGAIEFVGRKDRQVKIRGMRIEPEEIEAVLQSHPWVQEAAVIVRVDAQGDKSLQAFCTRVDDASFTPDELIADAKRHLPGYMVPNSLFVVEALPLDVNGKIDRRRLESTVPEVVKEEAEHPPITEIERTVAAVWREILGLSVVEVHRSFFEYGGHSLTAAILSSRLEQALEVPVPLREIFEHPTIAALAAQLSGPSRAPHRRRTRVARNPKRAHYPLSFAERMVYAHQHATKRNHGYHNVFPMLIEGPLDIEKLEQALREVVQRHEAFRSAFVLRDGLPVKTVASRADFRLVCAQGTESDVPTVVSRLREAYDLASPPLFRACLLTLGHQRHVLVVANHHIVSDGVTETLFMHEIGQLYRDEPLDPRPLQYTDYTLWQQREWEEGRYRAQEQHWVERLRGPLPVLELPLDHPRPSETNFDGHTVTIRLDVEQTSRLRDLAKAHHTTLFTPLFAAYTVLLHKYSGQEDLIVGIPVANRMHADVQSIAGMFVNMVPLRTRPAPGVAFADYLHSVKAEALSAFEHQDYPFERMVHSFQGERDPSRNPLFDTIFAYQSTGPAVLEIEGLRIAPYSLPNASAKVDLTVEVFECSDEIQLSFTYATALFRESTILRMGESFLRLVSDIVLDPGKPLRMLAWLPAGAGFGVYELSVYPRDGSLFGLFEGCVGRFARRVAVRFRDEVLTYAQLHARAESMAVRLLDLGVRPGEPVALMTARSVEMVVGIWAILRVGATYVPIDPGYPQKRVESILRDSGAQVC
ncbi:non-ribosomal peptide synthetase, partial [Mycobacterium montefiorense]